MFNDEACIDQVNESNIVLIPKIKVLKSMFHFRLINLCNVIYKLIAKALSNGLKIALPHCIGEC